MAKIAQNLLELIGNTPLVQLSRFAQTEGLNARILAKVESFNPLGSVKDRVGYALIADAEEKGLINRDTLIIEPTSGNTGIGLAYTAAIKGYRLILTMPESMSRERRSLLKALGAELVLTPAAKGMQGAIDRAKELREEHPNSYIPGQFTNPANAEAHRRTTAQEILRDMDGKVDYFVSAIGTGGTITGIGEVLKAHDPERALSPWSPPLRQCSPAESRGRIKFRVLARALCQRCSIRRFMMKLLRLKMTTPFPPPAWPPKRKACWLESRRAQRCMPQKCLPNDRRMQARQSLCCCQIRGSVTSPQSCLIRIKRERIKRTPHGIDLHPNC